MDYGSLIRRSWTLTWHHRFLWILGLFAGGSFGGSCSTSGGNPASSLGSGSPGEEAPDLGPAYDAIVRWFSENWWVILLAVTAVIGLGLVFLVISLIAQGGTASATAELALGRPSSLGASWRAGSRLFWRYLGLWLLLVALGLGVVIVVGGIGLAVALAFGLTDESSLFLALTVGGLLLVLLALIAIPLFVALSIVVAYAQRAIAVEDVGPLDALRVGVRVLRQRPLVSVVSWLIHLVLSFAAGILILIVLAVLAIPLAVLGFLIYLAVDLSAPLFVYAGVAVVLVALAVWLIGGITNAYFWSFWTLVYLRCTNRLGERLEASTTAP